MVVGSHGYLTVPLAVVRQYLSEARVSRTGSGVVRHYHVQVTSEPEFEAFNFAGSGQRIPLRQYYVPFIGSQESNARSARGLPRVVV
jgi:hypothetical protein